jgi:hypothetical protein
MNALCLGDYINVLRDNPKKSKPKPDKAGDVNKVLTIAINKSTSKINFNVYMMKKLFALCLFLHLFLIAGCTQQENHSSSQKIIIVVIDGARYSETINSGAENIPYMFNDLWPLGTVFTNFRIADEGITSTNPGHASILTGNWQLIANDGTESPNKPTVFEYFRKELSAKETDCFIVAGKKKLEVLSYSSFPGYGKDYKASTNCFDSESNNEVYDTLIISLNTYHPRLVLVNFPMADKKAHSGSWDEYIASIKNADSLIYLLYSKLQDDPFYKNKTTLLITNDHGRHTTDFTNHGDDCDGCEHIMLLAVGGKFESNKINPDLYYQIDLCKTVGDIMEFKTPFANGSSLVKK